MVESHRLYAGSGPGPSLSLVEAELPLEPRSLNNLEAVRAGPVSSEAGCNETYTRLTHPTLGKTRTLNTQDNTCRIALKMTAGTILNRKGTFSSS